MENQIVIYKNNDGNIECSVNLRDNTLWLSLDQIATVFQKNKSTISRHIKNIFVTEELDKDSVVAFFATTANDGKTYNVAYYNLDMIISVGYRINSKIATNFRKWATNVLKNYLTQGYAINEKLLSDKQEKIQTLQTTVSLLTRSLTNQIESLDDAQQVAKILDNFAKGLDLLDNFDHKTLDVKGSTQKEAVIIPVKEFLSVINEMKSEFASDVFANPKDDSFESSVNQIYQTFGGNDCYPTLEEKAAMLLYLITKNHSFSDGNKRIAASCFLYFLEKNGILYKNNLPIIDNGTLFALTILIAESNPKEMETMKQIVISVLNQGGVCD
ncbi:TPA: hypothetical protein CPT96_08960 [Candidatus Gastranaerophilales bacterium HUM_10]|nr:MAG TPA: hypothetical protein CPT96_08960 [Candidatus Gastranaerophilales bacterium HUM_10]DAB15981.1 MAG TPA: hypothetical protein CPT97_06935 [Candidatus Gastranaerophilales bacterium HUM_17]DAB17106.1 MAG TPA: hypothetical protein CPT98_06675 [Candidatus Gastranaerophilales bacterium HUM_19]DAB26358.1 MAG TPA: hypothetical protein CPT86_02760 [Candidatus Gastranaerophilales bacterium HUM_23]